MTIEDEMAASRAEQEKLTEKLCPDGCEYTWVVANHYVCFRCGADIEDEQ